MNINSRNKLMRRLTALLIAAMLLCMIPLGALAEGKAAKFNTAARVYKKASTSSASMKVKKGLEVTLLATSGSWAKVERDGVIAYAKLSQLTVIEDQQAKYEALMKNAQPAVINKATKVYASAKTSSKATKVKKGMEVNLLAVNGSWAMVENDGAIAYIPVKYVTLASEYEKEPSYEELMKDAQPAVITKTTYVYKKASTSSKATKVKKGMEINLLAVNGSWAMVENDGAIAYMNKAYISTLEQAATPAPVPTATPKPDYSQYLKDAQDAAITQDTKVYETADTKSSYTSVSKGLEVQLLAVKSGWALVERSGAYGFVNAEHVAVLPKATATPTPTPKPTAAPESDYMSSSKYTNEQKCYLFLTKEAGLSAAAACGILANIRRECSFNPAAGSSYYGLCQWGGGRLTNLKNYCASNGYSQSSLEGQLKFLVYELKNKYPSVLKYLQSVPNTAAGAYDAAYHFCYYYECPASKASSSADRGALARDTYFPKYQI